MAGSSSARKREMAETSALDGLWALLQQAEELRSKHPRLLAETLRALLALWQVHSFLSIIKSAGLVRHQASDCCKRNLEEDWQLSNCITISLVPSIEDHTASACTSGLLYPRRCRR